MKDEKYRLLKLADVNDPMPKRAKKDGSQLKVWCPECKDLHSHRSLQYDTRNGAFKCWYCGLHGRITDVADGLDAGTSSIAEAPRQPKLSQPTQPQQRKGGGGKPQLGGEGSAEASTLSDYIELDASVLDTIADISLDPQERNPHQLAVRRYLLEQKIPPEFARRMGWGVACVNIKLKDEEQSKLRSCVVYRNYVEGLCCNAKFRAVTVVQQRVSRPDGSSYMRQVVEKGFTQESAYTPAAPYNIDCLRGAIGADTADSPLYICEGEKDCLTLRLLGFTYVISASNGAQSDPVKMFEAFRPWLEPFRQVVLCGDKDRPGRELMKRLAEYFDDREVSEVNWDRRAFGKDISEVYQRHGEDVARQMVLNADVVTRNDIQEYDSDAELDEICRLGCDTARQDKYSLGMGPLVDKHLMLTTEGGLIIVTGTPNTGKTDWLNFVCTSLMAHRDEAVCFCSFETPNKQRHLARLAQIWIGATPASALSREQHLGFVRRVVSHATHLNMRHLRPTATNILHRAERVLRRTPSMRYLVIDPYLYMDVGGGRNITETEAIKHMLTEVQDWAQEHRVWVIIVAHPRKLHKEDGTNELEKIDMYTIAGSANWANIADYIIALERVQKDEGRTDYTRLMVLKVRDQEVCQPGEVLLQRQACGRYDARRDLDACNRRAGEVDGAPWEG